MKNPIEKSELFATPSNMKELFDYCLQYNGSERIIAMTVACMAMNLSSEMIDKLIKENS